MKKLMFMTGFFVTVSCAKAQNWEPKAWQKYLIEQHIKKDTLNTHYTIMASHSSTPQKVNPYVLQFGTFYSPAPKGLFEEQEAAEERARRARGDYHFSNLITDFIGDVFVEVLNGIFFR